MSLETDLQAALLGGGDRLISPSEPAGVDDALVKAAQHGDRGAFGELYRRYARMVHGILLSRVPPAFVDDLVQDVFLQALPRLGTLRDASRFGGWLAAIARNRATDFHRKTKPDVALQEDVHAGVRQESSPDHASRSEAQLILQAVQALPEAYRETLTLRLVEGMTGPEIAARTGLSHGSVRVNLHRGMQQLREALARKNEALGPARNSP
jgi:RNA polymerase sigma-70 factor, ECF subfamily